MNCKNRHRNSTKFEFTNLSCSHFKVRESNESKTTSPLVTELKISADILFLIRYDDVYDLKNQNGNTNTSPDDLNSFHVVLTKKVSRLRSQTVLDTVLDVADDALVDDDTV